MDKYFGGFRDAEDVKEEFSKPDNPATEDEILFAEYYAEAYEGSAFVLFKRDGKLYEVLGAHCSCYGLEDQWKPEETSWAALKMRPNNDYYGVHDGQEVLNKLIEDGLEEEGS